MEGAILLGSANYCRLNGVESYAPGLLVELPMGSGRDTPVKKTGRGFLNPAWWVRCGGLFNSGRVLGMADSVADMSRQNALFESGF